MDLPIPSATTSNNSWFKCSGSSCPLIVNVSLPECPLCKSKLEPHQLSQEQQENLTVGDISNLNDSTTGQSQHTDSSQNQSPQRNVSQSPSAAQASSAQALFHTPSKQEEISDSGSQASPASSQLQYQQYHQQMFPHYMNMMMMQNGLNEESDSDQPGSPVKPEVINYDVYEGVLFTTNDEVALNARNDYTNCIDSLNIMYMMKEKSSKKDIYLDLKSSNEQVRNHNVQALCGVSWDLFEELFSKIEMLITAPMSKRLRQDVKRRHKKPHIRKSKISDQNRLLMILMWLKGHEQFYKLSAFFGISKSSFAQHRWHVISCLTRTLHEINYPSPSDLEKFSEQFKDDYIGVLSISEHRIHRPSPKDPMLGQKDYFSRSANVFTVKCLVLLSPFGECFSLETGFPGSMSAQEIWKNSNSRKWLDNLKYKVFTTMRIDDENNVVSYCGSNTSSVNGGSSNDSDSETNQKVMDIQNKYFNLLKQFYVTCCAPSISIEQMNTVLYVTMQITNMKYSQDQYRTPSVLGSAASANTTNAPFSINEQLGPGSMFTHNPATTPNSGAASSSNSGPTVPTEPTKQIKLELHPLKQRILVDLIPNDEDDTQKAKAERFVRCVTKNFFKPDKQVPALSEPAVASLSGDAHIHHEIIDAFITMVIPDNASNLGSLWMGNMLTPFYVYAFRYNLQHLDQFTTVPNSYIKHYQQQFAASNINAHEYSMYVHEHLSFTNLFSSLNMFNSYLSPSTKYIIVPWFDENQYRLFLVDIEHKVINFYTNVPNQESDDRAKQMLKWFLDHFTDDVYSVNSAIRTIRSSQTESGAFVCLYLYLKLRAPHFTDDDIDEHCTTPVAHAFRSFIRRVLQIQEFEELQLEQPPINPRKRKFRS
eukprot:gb/GECH01000439.1/.p1 GENE.gb/GECH01000439.1/~~gb/GECH01000439.1/.p1  ORF type:complete len:876 (+),score=178.08 gb/GECH01000439.1/:1-2628(+)